MSKMMTPRFAAAALSGAMSKDPNGYIAAATNAAAAADKMLELRRKRI